MQEGRGQGAALLFPASTVTCSSSSPPLSPSSHRLISCLFFHNLSILLPLFLMPLFSLPLASPLSLLPSPPVLPLRFPSNCLTPPSPPSLPLPPLPRSLHHSSTPTRFLPPSHRSSTCITALHRTDISSAILPGMTLAELSPRALPPSVLTRRVRRRADAAGPAARGRGGPGGARTRRARRRADAAGQAARGRGGPGGARTWIVAMGDEEARRRGVQKSVVERGGPREFVDDGLCTAVVLTSGMPCSRVEKRESKALQVLRQHGEVWVDGNVATASTVGRTGIGSNNSGGGLPGGSSAGVTRAGRAAGKFRESHCRMALPSIPFTIWLCLLSGSSGENSSDTESVSQIMSGDDADGGEWGRSAVWSGGMANSCAVQHVEQVVEVMGLAGTAHHTHHRLRSSRRPRAIPPDKISTIHDEAAREAVTAATTVAAAVAGVAAAAVAVSWVDGAGEDEEATRGAGRGSLDDEIDVLEAPLKRQAWQQCYHVPHISSSLLQLLGDYPLFWQYTGPLAASAFSPFMPQGGGAGVGWRVEGGAKEGLRAGGVEQRGGCVVENAAAAGWRTGPAAPLPPPSFPLPPPSFPPPSVMLPSSLRLASPLPPPFFPPPSTLLHPSLRPASPSLYPASPLPMPCFTPPSALLPLSLRPASPLPAPCFPPPCFPPPSPCFPPPSALLPPPLRPASPLPPPCFPPPSAQFPPTLIEVSVTHQVPSRHARFLLVARSPPLVTRASPPPLQLGSVCPYRQPLPTSPSTPSCVATPPYALAPSSRSNSFHTDVRGRAGETEGDGQGGCSVHPPIYSPLPHLLSPSPPPCFPPPSALLRPSFGHASLIPLPHPLPFFPSSPSLLPPIPFPASPHPLSMRPSTPCPGVLPLSLLHSALSLSFLPHSLSLSVLSHSLTRPLALSLTFPPPSGLLPPTLCPVPYLPSQSLRFPPCPALPFRIPSQPFPSFSCPPLPPHSSPSAL
ncbi:unnamed protein product [Closterium sp. NIES-64]|nr:unnamed protein product [Closterium sp. NIES-64]